MHAVIGHVEVGIAREFALEFDLLVLRQALEDVS